jgi:ribosomal-protein-alanine N-acetyltransferase
VESAHIIIRPFTEAEARQAARWTYDAPFDLYDSDEANEGLFLEREEDGTGYYALLDGGADRELLGFCCFGAEARVVGQDEQEGTLDLGGGLRPDRLSRGLATVLLPSVCAFAVAHWAPERLRVAIAAFNERSIRLCRSAQFEVVRTFRRPDGQEFVELHRRVVSPT